jgi:hypothetical protein
VRGPSALRGRRPAHAGEDPQDPPRRKAPAFSHTNQDKIAPPNITVDHTNQDEKKPKDPGGDGNEEKKDHGRALVWDPDRPLAFDLNWHHGSQAAPRLSLVPGMGYAAPVANAMSFGTGGTGAASDLAISVIPGPGVLAPLLLAGLIGTRRRRC